MAFAGNPPVPAGAMIRDAPLSCYVLKSRFESMIADVFEGAETQGYARLIDC
ncbi:MAG: hypothetical protein AB9Q20_04135 [Candidatus Reddybacter sp.]